MTGPRTNRTVFRQVAVAAWLSATMLSSFAQQPDTGKSVIYMTASGAADADGATPEAGMPTLQAALDLAQKRFRGGQDDITIVVLPGRYLGQQAKTSGAGKGHHLTITTRGRNRRAVFDGAGEAETWLTIAGRVGEPANLTIAALDIANYATAITMNGSRDALDNVVSHVVIKENTFEKTGQVSAGRKAPSTAVLRLVNGDDNQIIGNRFLHFRNAEKCTLLHAIYIAHNSTGNLIKDNYFEDGCGDAIRFRDASSNNRVEGNKFVDAWEAAPITDWYCDSSSRSDCTKLTPECPSLNNRLAGNEMSARAAHDNGITKEFGSLVTKNCPVPDGARRFIIK